jgi:NAD(P)-dependent dehydrogenase (short-subunit alcohol dehydrogenase family)
MNLAGAGTLVAGATGAFGGAIARELGRRGARLALSGRDEARLAALAGELGAAASITADLTVTGEPERLVEASADALGGLDVAVCAIGIVAFGPARDVEDDVLRALIDVNVLAPARLARAAAGRMGRGAVIVNVSAIVAEMPTAGMAAYSASKAALTAFDRAAGRELRREGIRLIDVRPPHMATGLEARPIAGEPPRLPEGQDPDAWAARVADAIEEEGRTDLGPDP